MSTPTVKSNLLVLKEKEALHLSQHPQLGADSAAK
jgi:hypothetical protein